MKLYYCILSALILWVSFCSCNSTKAGREEDVEIFEYRDIYLPDYNKNSNAALELDDVEQAWGIWGHHLGNVLPHDPSPETFARVKDDILEDQFCFSSSDLYDYIVDYIHGEYLFTDSVRFAILPNDNDIVCLCHECVANGNKAGDASPAVFKLLEKLSKKFPQHMFFTSYYSTTRSLPEKNMPSNTGVIVSAMDYPLTTHETRQETHFMDLLKKWSEKTDKVYVWDYVNNFDDYFTPYPVFSVMQRRLKNYRDAGVDGVFLNGSGPDYSVLGRLKKAVLSQLMINPDLDWEELLKKYAKDYYPLAGDDIAEFIIAQEKMVQVNKKILPMYDGVELAIDIYLPEQDFMEFYNKMVQHKRKATGAEKEDLELMTDAMALTVLELKRINHDLDGTEKLKERLRRLPARNIPYYNEGCWSIDQYLSSYEFMEKDAHETAETNLLKDKEITPLTELDEEYENISILTDGQLGIPSNYHNGNLISSADPYLRLSIPRVPGMKKIRVWMVNSPGFKIGLPSEVALSSGGLPLKSQIPEKPQHGTGHSYLDFDVPPTGDIILTLYKNPDIKTMAIDEIQAF